MSPAIRPIARRAAAIALTCVLISPAAQSQQALPELSGLGTLGSQLLASCPGASGAFRPPESEQGGHGTWSTRFTDARLVGSDDRLTTREVGGVHNAGRTARWGLAIRQEALTPGLSTMSVRASFTRLVPVAAGKHLVAGIGLGMLRIQADAAAGIWESQYLLNPLDPASAPSGEISRTNFARVVPDLAGHLGFSSSRKGQILYAFHHLPFDLSMLYGDRRGANLHHQLMAQKRGATTFVGLPFDWTARLIAQRQSGGQFFAASTWASFAFREESVYTDFARTPKILLGLTLTSTGSLSPILGLDWKELGSLWIAHAAPLGPMTRLSVWQVGLSATLP